jgi:nucleoid DNA-binding protein
MAELKTKKTGKSVKAFLNSIEDEKKRSDCVEISAMMQQATGKKPQMWGGTIVGFGKYHYKYASGREGEWHLTGFSPRKQNIAVYIMPGFSDFQELMEGLGRYKTGKSCLYIKQLDDVDRAVLTELVAQSFEWMGRKYETS